MNTKYVTLALVEGDHAQVAPSVFAFLRSV